jgi:hypothetical protein
MINLLPENEKKFFKKEYRLRVATVMLAMIFTLIVTLGVLLLPSVALTMYKRRVAQNSSIQPVTTIQKEYSELLKEVNAAKAYMVILAPEKPRVQATDVVALVTKHKLPGIKVTGVQYTATDKAGFKVIIHGVAQSRQSLIDFRAALEKEPGIEKIQLPVSNLIKDTNIDFSFEITNKPMP